IRAILTQEPRERNDAIDRLLGLSVYRNLQEALVKVKAADRQRAMRAQFEAFEQRVQTALTTRKHDLEELRQEAARAGIALHHHREDRALTKAAAVKRSLEAFAGDVGLALPALALPGAWTELPIFDAAARKAVTWLRREMPSAKEQQDLFRRQKGLLDLQA